MIQCLGQARFHKLDSVICSVRPPFSSCFLRNLEIRQLLYTKRTIKVLKSLLLLCIYRITFVLGKIKLVLKNSWISPGKIFNLLCMNPGSTSDCPPIMSLQGAHAYSCSPCANACVPRGLPSPCIVHVLSAVMYQKFSSVTSGNGDNGGVDLRHIVKMVMLQCLYVGTAIFGGYKY